MGEVLKAELDGKAYDSTGEASSKLTQKVAGAIKTKLKGKQPTTTTTCGRHLITCQIRFTKNLLKHHRSVTNHAFAIVYGRASDGQI